MADTTTINATLVAEINRIVMEWNTADTQARAMFHGWEQRAARAGLERGAMQQIGGAADRLNEQFGLGDDVELGVLGEVAFRAYKSGAVTIARDGA